MKLTLSYIFSFLFLFINFATVGQVNSEQVIILENQQYKNAFSAFIKNNPKTVKIKEGKKILYQLKKDDEIKKGTVTEIKKDAIKIDGQPYKISQFSMIGAVIPGTIVKTIAGPVIFASGVALMASGTYLGGYAIANYLNEPIILLEGLKVTKSYFVFRTIPGMLASVVIGLGANVLGFHVAKHGVKTTFVPFKRTKFNLAGGKEWKAKIEEVKPPEKKVKEEKEKLAN